MVITEAKKKKVRKNISKIRKALLHVPTILIVTFITALFVAGSILFKTAKAGELMAATGKRQKKMYPEEGMTNEDINDIRMAIYGMGGVFATLSALTIGVVGIIIASIATIINRCLDDREKQKVINNIDAKLRSKIKTKTQLRRYKTIKKYLDKKRKQISGR